MSLWTDNPTSKYVKFYKKDIKNIIDELRKSKE